jgi:hypothetical protein
VLRFLLPVAIVILSQYHRKPSELIGTNIMLDAAKKPPIGFFCLEGPKLCCCAL